MKNLFTILLALLIAAAPLGCEKEEKEDCKCDECPCEMIRDAGPEEEEDDLGLDAGQEAGDQDVSGEEAGQQAGEMAGEEPVEGGEQAGEMIEEEPIEGGAADCECAGADDCDC